MSDEPDQAYQIIVTVDITAADSAISVDCGRLSPRIAHMALEAAADALAGAGTWAAVAEHNGITLIAAPVEDD